VNFKMVTASRGKAQRAEPFSALYEEGKVRHVGVFAKAEDELCAFSTAATPARAHRTAPTP
jgi:phage terminase large subunit-like protein